jgi:hypothetical protein
MLSTELANNDKPPQVRKLAGILIKIALEAKVNQNSKFFVSPLSQYILTAPLGRGKG